jgi:hypothetical protein
MTDHLTDPVAAGLPQGGGFGIGQQRATTGGNSQAILIN